MKKKREAEEDGEESVTLALNTVRVSLGPGVGVVLSSPCEPMAYLISEAERMSQNISRRAGPELDNHYRNGGDVR